MKPLAGLFRANDSLIFRPPRNNGLPKRWTLASHLSPELNTSVTDKKACLHQTDALSTHVFGQTPGLFFFQYPEPAPEPGRSCSPFTHTGIFYQKSRPFPLSDDNFFPVAGNKKGGKRRLLSLILPSQSELVRDTELDAGHRIIGCTIAVIYRTDILVTAVDIHDIGVKLGAFGQIVAITQRILVGMAVMW